MEKEALIEQFSADLPDIMGAKILDIPGEIGRLCANLPAGRQVVAPA